MPHCLASAKRTPKGHFSLNQIQIVPGSNRCKPFRNNRLRPRTDFSPDSHEALQSPPPSFWSELQKRSIRAAVQGPFHESVMGIAEITGVSIPKRSLEEVLLDAAQDFDAFYQEHAPDLDTGSILVAAVDGKGIPMVQPEGAKTTG